MIYHNCASLCSLIKEKEEEKTIYISLAFINYGNYNQHFVDYLMVSNRQVTVGFLLLRRGTQEVNNLYWTEVRISVLTRFDLYFLCGFIKVLSIEPIDLCTFV